MRQGGKAGRWNDRRCAGGGRLQGRQASRRRADGVKEAARNRRRATGVQWQARGPRGESAVVYACRGRGQQVAGEGLVRACAISRKAGI